MSEWWTYRLSDFLMFSPATYWRLVERYNREVWPLQLLMLAAGLLLIWRTAVRPADRRILAVVLAAVWIWVGWAFHWRRYAPINWAAEYFAAVYALQAMLLLAAGLPRPAGNPGASTGIREIGVALASIGVLVYPISGVLAGRPWSQAEVFGLMPEPTALATLGLLLATGQGRRGWLLLIPVLSLLVGIATASLVSR